MSKLNLFLLDTPQLEIDGTPIELDRRKAMALLAYLAVTQKSHSRDSLAALFWPEADQGRARTILRRNLWTLNKALGDGWLDISRDTIGTDGNPNLWVDVNQFQDELAACQTHNHSEAAVCPDCLSHLYEAISLYRDDFLAGFTLRDSPGFDEWQRIQTESLRRELAEALERLARGQSANEDFKAAIPYAQRWLALDPLHEPAYRQLMELYARAGQRAAALHQYSECERILQEELGVPPGMETTALAERIRLESEGQQGQLIKSYELQELIGAGGFGEVYRAYQPQVRREVAVKVILPQFANQPEFIRRFEAEAHIVAQLEHPHIVPLYDYWREPDGAYLVMRWLRGGNLEDDLKTGPWSPEATAQMLDQIAAALMLAHQRDIIHRDLKPANFLLDEGGNVYLTDFGIAKVVAAPRSASQTQAGVVLGSPAYMAPEVANDEPLTPQTDIYSLGVMLYEILTGQHPFPDTTPPMMLVKHLSEPLPPLGLSNPDLSIALDKVIQRATVKNPADRYADTISLAVDFRQVLTPDQVAIIGQPDESTPLLVQNPYKGLRAFQEGDAADFYGREALVEQVLIRLVLNMPTKRQASISRSTQSPHLQNFLAIVGPSGSGKSSLVKAGLIPALRQNAIPDSKDWFIVEMTPGPHPLEELESALLRIAINPPATLLEQLREDERGLLRAVKRILPDDESTLLLVIDQFEEVFTLVEDEAVRSLLLNSLHLAVTEPESRLRVVITLRADFYDRPLLYPGFGDLLRQRMETILPLSTEDLEQAIARPAERAGATLEAGLIPLIIADVQEQPGTLPLMQYALTELFEQRQGRLLTIDAYQNSGGVMGALARRADELYTELNDAARAAARRLFMRLVSLGEGGSDGPSSPDTRRRVLRSELEDFGDDEDQRDSQFQNPKSKAQNVIDTFGRHRLLTFDHDPATRGPTVEVAHEALIREWDRLRGWLDEDREFLFWQQRLRAGLHQWEASAYDEGALLRGAPLAEAENWLTQRRPDLNETEREFIQAGLALRERRAAEREAQLRRELEVAQELAKEAEARRLAEEQHAQEAEARAQEQAARAQEQAQAATSLRRRAVWLAGVGVVAVLLAIAAGVFGVQATARQKEAEHQARQARSAQLATQTQNVLNRGEDPSGSLPLMLARQAVLTTLAEDGDFTFEADAALRLAIDAASPWRMTLPHMDAVNSAAFSPDGQTIVTASHDGIVRLWDVATGDETRRFEGHSEWVNKAVFSPDGQTLVSGSGDKTARLWNVATGEEIHRWESYNQVKSVVFSPDGQAIVTTGYGDPIQKWDIASGRAIQIQRLGPSTIWWVAFSPDGQTVVTIEGSTGEATTPQLWDITTGQQIGRLEGHTDDVNWAVFSPNGQTIVTASGGDFAYTDNSVRIWDATTSEEIRHLEGHIDYVNSATFSPDGQTIVSASNDGMARLWDVTTGEEILRLEGHTDWVSTAAFSPDGQTVVTASLDGTVRLWNVTTGAASRRLEGHTDWVNTAVFSPVPDNQTVLTASDDRAACLWDVATGREIRCLEGEIDAVNSAAFSPDAQTIVTAHGSALGGDVTARLWDTTTGQEIRRFEGHTDIVNSAAFSPDGQTIVTASDDQTARLWETNSGQELLRFEGHTDKVNSAAFSPDAQTIVTAGNDQTARLWNVATGQETLRLEGHTDWVNSATFSPDGQTVVTASADKTARLWDAATGEEIRRFEVHSDWVNAAVFSPDGKKLVTTGSDNSVVVWDVATGEVIRRLDGHTDKVFSAAFSPDGQAIITASADRTARVWPSVEALLEEAKSLIQRDPPELTPQERIRFGLETE